MNIQTDKMHMIFRKNYEDRTLYTTSIRRNKMEHMKKRICQFNLKKV